MNLSYNDITLGKLSKYFLMNLNNDISTPKKQYSYPKVRDCFCLIISKYCLGCNCFLDIKMIENEPIKFVAEKENIKLGSDFQ